VGITQNAKGQSLLQALDVGFRKAAELGAARKAIIFTESRRTQNYLLRLLADTPYAGRIVLFNGSNNDDKSKEIYAAWKQKHKDSDRLTGSRAADIRSALVDYFREEGQIMIATEAAAEGVNLQFCSLVVNYDLPWNPQRIEQRIGRCHRYGQQHDVVVVNLLNRKNAADQRVYQLLSEKFQLFSGVFGASDEVLGSIESGVDFEKRIVAIYQTCRTPEEIQASFDALQAELSAQIDENLKLTRQKLLENFDEEVHDKLRAHQLESQVCLDRYESMLWRLTRFALDDFADFDGDCYSFLLRRQPFADLQVPVGPYRLGRHVDDTHIYRPSHPLAERLITEALQRPLPPAELVFDYARYEGKISILEPLIGQSGVLELHRLTIESLDVEDHLIFAARTDNGHVLDEEICCRLMQLPATVRPVPATDANLTQVVQERIAQRLKAMETRNLRFFEEEVSKLDAWSEDLKHGLEAEIKDLDRDIRQAKRDSKLAGSLADKLELQKQVKQMEQTRTKKRKELFEEQDKIDVRRDILIEQLESRIQQRTNLLPIFSTRWGLR